MFDFWKIFSWIFSISMLAGSILNARKKSISFVIWGVSDFCLVIFNAVSGIYSQAFMLFFLLIFNIYGYFSFKHSPEYVDEKIKNFLGIKR